MAVYYVRADGLGSDSNDGLTFETAWATLEYADSRVTSGHELRICSDEANPFTCGVLYTNEGATWTGASLVDGGVLEVSHAPVIITAFLQLKKNTKICGLRVDFGGNNSYISSIGYNIRSINRCILENSRGAYGAVRLGTASQYVALSDCVVRNCDIGIKIDTHALYLYLLNTEVHSCGVGVKDNNPGGTKETVLVGNRIHSNTGAGFENGNGYATLIGNVFANNGLEGAKIPYNASINTNNIFAHNGGYGLVRAESGTSKGQGMSAGNNCYFGNTSGPSDKPILGVNNVFTDPKFTDAPNGDYSLQSDSPCIGAGLGYNP